MDYFDRLLNENKIEVKAECDDSGVNNANSVCGCKTNEGVSRESETCDPEAVGQKKFDLRLLIGLLDIFVAIPLTFVICYLSGDRKMYITSIIILVLAMLPFFISFERKKYDARMLALLSVLTAVTIVSRIAFAFIPAFVPMAGFIIIVAMNFGPQAGFMCGSIGMIVSNMLFGQGPWTPWQMFGYGLIGLFAGLLYKAGIISEKHLIRSSIISFFLVCILSSAFLDSATLFFMYTKFSNTSILAIYLAGLPMNILNSFASALAVLLLSKPAAGIIGRIKMKYGM